MKNQTQIKTKVEHNKEAEAILTDNGFKPRQPDYSSDGVAVWLNSKDDKQYLTIKLVGHNPIYALKNQPE